MAFLRFVAMIVMCAAATLSDVRSSFAQGLSDASLVIGTNWSGGYMALGGHLGQAIARPARVKETATRHRPRVQKIRNVLPVPVAKRRDVTPLYLVSMSLDSTGLNVAALRPH